MRVLLVEDSEFIRQQFLRLFDEVGFVTVVGYADREDDAVAAIATLQPDVVLVDLNLQGGSGMHVLSRARQEGYTGKLFVLSSRDPDFYRALCERHGADGFYDKAHEQGQLIADLKALAAAGPSN
ncbi:response regulator [Roseateles chitosanitabidus]|jgi:DNA-binding NarL/FixJ family response regulator|uniref:response regulator n=1 Tax=Roseateles chitosanitabidus TaxID=65048 RepID=UPI000834CA61|nr:response regulator [Roseateles chitosanitabidus]MBO9688548.1 response regulator transcription factor [Roseateles chitosanitabidus]